MDAYRIEDCIAQASVGMSGRNYLRIEDGRGIEVSAAVGRFEAFLDKYWVPLFSSSARPTTAAL